MIDGFVDDALSFNSGIWK